MTRYIIRRDPVQEINPYSVWRDDGDLIEEDLSYGQVIYWTIRELARYVEMGLLSQSQAEGMRGDIEAYNAFISRLTGA